MLSNKDLLQKYWGHHQFRPLQEDIINHILNHKDVFAILPTGMGKSVCYQIPALQLKGVCIVISPLIALIEDQVKQLKNKDIDVAFIPSNANIKEILQIFDNITYRKTKLLYLSPERFSQQIIQDRIKELEVSFFAIDEAHCVTEWGHDFRPAYLNLSILKQLKPQTNILALTATATTDTQLAVINILKLQNPSILKTDLYKENLAIKIYHTPDKLDLLIKLLKSFATPSIIYLQNRLAVEELCKRLHQNNLKSTFYHAGLSKEEKKINSEQWFSEESNIMIATNAFGMGIDKSNVRLVIHLEIPQNLENYVQEIGRAGRDGHKAFSCVILQKSDYLKFEEKIKSTQNPIDSIKKVYQNLNQYFQIGLGELPEDVFHLNIDEFCNRYQLKPTETLKAIQSFHHYGILSYSETNKDICEIKLTTSTNAILNFINKNKDYQILVTYLLRNHTGIFDVSKKINLSKTSQLTQISIDQIVEQLKQLQLLNLVSFNHGKYNLSLSFLKPREDSYTINSISSSIKKHWEIGLQKNKAALAFFKNHKTCRNQIILDYFAIENSKPCHQCDVCEMNNKTNQQQVSTRLIINTLKNNSASFNELLIQTKLPTLLLIEILNLLILEEIIRIQHNQYQII